MSPKVQAFEQRDIIITCGNKVTFVCFRYIDDNVDITLYGGIKDIQIE
ncbi:MAG: hypothetical protein WC967_00625 [Balneolaceae bacterium]